MDRRGLGHEFSDRQLSEINTMGQTVREMQSRTHMRTHRHEGQDTYMYKDRQARSQIKKMAS